MHVVVVHKGLFISSLYYTEVYLCILQCYASINNSQILVVQRVLLKYDLMQNPAPVITYSK